MNSFGSSILFYSYLFAFVLQLPHPIFNSQSFLCHRSQPGCRPPMTKASALSNNAYFERDVRRTQSPPQLFVNPSTAETITPPSTTTLLEKKPVIVQHP